MNVLVINCGSSSLKFSVVDTETGADLANGLYDKLGSERPVAKLRAHGSETKVERALNPGDNHAAALESLSSFLAEPENRSIAIAAVGHRVVHGAERFRAASRIDDDFLAAVESCNTLAPLHNPANVLGIRTALKSFPSLPQVGVFDTAFHQTISREGYLYALPIELYEKHRIRRYGFHGSSHKYIALEAARRLGKSPDRTSLITAHLGNGCSATAIQNGRSVDTTMGLTPLEGLVMGTRSGDVDPGIILHLHRALGLTVDEIDKLLNKQSGLLGLSQISNDMRALRQKEAAGDESAHLAIAIFVRRLAKSISGLRASLDTLDAIVFTGGIGENDALTRAETLARLGHLGAKLDPAANADAGRSANGCISTPDSTVRALVIPTNEELMIARETAEVLSRKQP